MSDPKAILLGYLQDGRDAVMWKLEDVSEYDARRPMTFTGTNLLGVVKHVASVEAGYFGECFGRPFDQPFPWFDDNAEPNTDMWATADESLDAIADLYRRVWVHSDATITALDLDARGRVPWWRPEKQQVTLQQLLVHMIAETHRHAGHMDIVRELIDERVGWKAQSRIMPDIDWSTYRAQVQAVADQFRRPPA